MAEDVMEDRSSTRMFWVYLGEEEAAKRYRGDKAALWKDKKNSSSRESRHLSMVLPTVPRFPELHP